MIGDVEPDHGERRRPLARWAPIAAIGVLLVLGLVPFTVRNGVMRAHCNGALVESWPEPSGGIGWFNYAPNSGTFSVTGRPRASLCGTEARRRVVVPLLAVSAVGVAVLAQRAIHPRR